MWKKHLEILLRCWVIWETQNSPPPPLRRFIWEAGFGALATQFGIFSTFESRQIQAPFRGGGGGLGSPLAAFPQTQALVFWLFLQSYLTCGPFSCWHFLLFKQRFFWYYSSCQVMAILCCVAQKAASAAQAPEYPIRTISNFFENSWRYSRINVYQRCQQHQRKKRKILR